MNPFPAKIGKEMRGRSSFGRVSKPIQRTKGIQA